MRTCSNCKVADQPVMDFSRDCSSQCDPQIRDVGEAELHHVACNKVLHEVRPYFQPVTLQVTPKHPEGELPYRWQREGWKLRKDGTSLFRWKMLCRNCIDKEALREALQRDYQKACKAARGQDDRTYGQLMIQQGQS